MSTRGWKLLGMAGSVGILARLARAGPWALVGVLVGVWGYLEQMPGHIRPAWPRGVWQDRAAESPLCSFSSSVARGPSAVRRPLPPLVSTCPELAQGSRRQANLHREGGFIYQTHPHPHPQHRPPLPIPPPHRHPAPHAALRQPDRERYSRKRCQPHANKPSRTHRCLSKTRHCSTLSLSRFRNLTRHNSPHVHLHA
ncbi:hypothetical protein DFH27DRAFT_189034 [Peziza echinospora]|nr:hypothetical protein DFH27DRAFT_189034 [Peziza echinospora]